MTRKICAIYCRASKDEYNSISEMITKQRIELCEYADDNRLSIYSIYIDIDPNAKEGERPAFEQLIKDARRGMFDIIICKNILSFISDANQLDYYFHKAFALWNIDFLALDDGIDTRIKSNKKTKQLNNVVNEWYMVDCGAGVNGNKSGRLRGNAAFGYKKLSEGKIELDCVASKIVQEIYAMYITGHSKKAIIRHLNGLAVPTPSEYLRKANNTLYSKKYKSCWTEYTIGKILTNEQYAGLNFYPQIISKETFTSVQQLIYSKKNENETCNGLYLLEGLTYCSHCGARLRRICCIYKGSRKHYLVCGGTQSGRLCATYKIDLEILTNDINNIIKTHIVEYLAELDEQLIYSNDKNPKIILNSAVKQINKQIENLSQLQKTVRQDYISGKILPEEYIRTKMHYKDDIVQYYSSLNHLLQLSCKQNISSKSSRLINTDAYNNRLIRLLINKIEIKKVANQFTSIISWNF